MITDEDMRHLRRCVELSVEAVGAGEQPFGSVLVTADGTVVAEDRNRVHATGDATAHPEFELARVAARRLTADERAGATLYTSGEHCPMCAAAHAWVGLGRVAYVCSSAQLTTWWGGFGAPPPPVRTLPVQEIAPDVRVDGPVPEFADEMYELHRRVFAR